MPVPVPPRLHVLLARDAQSGVIIRRGPTRHTALIGWDRRHDRFEIGQWLYGRIYERRCDLSPDGQHLIYFAMNGRWQSRTRGSWTAISRAPFLKALTLYAKGDCWQGGGLFLSRSEYWLNGACMHTLLEDRSRLKASTEYPWPESYGGECPGVYYLRLQRDGWRFKYTAPDGAGGQVSVFEKPVAGHWWLRKCAHATLFREPGRGVYFDTHELFNAQRRGAGAAGLGVGGPGRPSPGLGRGRQTLDGPPQWRPGRDPGTLRYQAAGLRAHRGAVLSAVTPLPRAAKKTTPNGVVFFSR
jgi:hypothetical protein